MPGNPLVRFDEGRVGRTRKVSPSLLLYWPNVFFGNWLHTAPMRWGGLQAANQNASRNHSMRGGESSTMLTISKRVSRHGISARRA